MFFMVVTGVLLLAGLALLPPLLQRLYGYSVLQSGLLTMPRGVGTLITMVACRAIDREGRSAHSGGIGDGLMAWSLHIMSGFSIEMAVARSSSQA